GVHPCIFLAFRLHKPCTDSGLRHESGSKRIRRTTGNDRLAAVDCSAILPCAEFSRTCCENDSYWSLGESVHVGLKRDGARSASGDKGLCDLKIGIRAGFAYEN